MPHTAVLDEFRMTNPDGSFVADITPEFLDRLIAHMQEREALTGDLCPLVIGHTQDGLAEVDQPPLVGYARNWHKGLLGDTGRQCAFADFWILKTRVEQVKQFPRRSGEVWASRYEIDPISLLGATTPARDLGILKLSREGSFTYTAPGDMNMPEDDKKDKKEDKKDGAPKADPKESGEAKGSDGKLDQILAKLTELLSTLKPDAGAAAPAGPGAAPAGDGQMSDEDFEKFLQEMQGGGGAGGDDASRAGQKPTPNEGGVSYPGQSDTVVPDKANKMQRSPLEQRVIDLEAEVERGRVKDTLVKLARPDVANPEDSQFVEDLVALHPDVRKRLVERLAKTPTAPGQSTHLARALDGAIAGGTKGKRMGQEDAIRLSRKASEQKKTFAQVAAEEGFDLS